MGVVISVLALRKCVSAQAVRPYRDNPRSRTRPRASAIVILRSRTLMFSSLPCNLQQLRPPRNKRELLATFDHGETLHWQVDRADVFATRRGSARTSRKPLSPGGESLDWPVGHGFNTGVAHFALCRHRGWAHILKPTRARTGGEKISSGGEAARRAVRDLRGLGCVYGGEPVKSIKKRAVEGL